MENSKLNYTAGAGFLNYIIFDEATGKRRQPMQKVDVNAFKSASWLD